MRAELLGAAIFLLASQPAGAADPKLYWPETSLDEIRRKPEFEAMRFAIKAECLCVEGEDLGRELPPVRATRRDAGDPREHEGPLRTFLAHIDTRADGAPLRALVTWYYKFLLRDAFLLVMEREGVHEPEFKESLIADYIFEPDARAILDVLVPRYLNYQLWRALLESNAAEQGARMVAMDNATSNADELLRSLRLQYNRARQSAITTEILEIISGANALEAS